MDESTFWWLFAGLAVAAELMTGTFYLLMLAVGLAGAALAARAIESIDDDEAQLLVRNVLFTQAASYAWAPPAGRLLAAAVSDQTHQPAVEAAFRAARDWVAANRETIVMIVAACVSC